MRVLFLFLIIFTTFPAQAAVEKTDHPLVTAYSGSILKRKDVKDFDEYSAFTGRDNAQDLPTGPSLKGKVTRIMYKNPKDRSILEIFSNYEQALKNSGAIITFQCNQEKAECLKGYAQSKLNAYNGTVAISNTKGRYLFGKLAKEGTTAYIAVAVGQSFTGVDIIEIKEMDTGMVAVNAEALGQGLEQNGYVVVEGIYFDTDKTTVKPESKPALEEVSKLLKSNTALNVFVVGHTDMQGNLAHNMQLSEGRAKTIVNTLVSDYGIAAGRLEGHGVGPLAPQASNKTENGKALNRRVVLVAR